MHANHPLSFAELNDSDLCNLACVHNNLSMQIQKAILTHFKAPDLPIICGMAVYANACTVRHSAARWHLITLCAHVHKFVFTGPQGLSGHVQIFGRLFTANLAVFCNHEYICCSGHCFEPYDMGKVCLCEFGAPCPAALHTTCNLSEPSL